MNYINLKPKLKKSTKLKIYNSLALHILLYGSMIWMIMEKHMSRLKKTEKKFFRKTAGTLLNLKKKNRRAE